MHSGHHPHFPMRFEFATATRIIFGPGTLREAGPIARDFGAKALLVTGSDALRAHYLVSLLGREGVSVTPFSVRGEPQIETVAEGVAAAKEAGCTVVIGFGGGSAIDAAKAIAGMMTNGGSDIMEHLEIVGRGRPLMNPATPLIAIPTTAGTGAEVTRNAVLSSEEKKVKVSLRSPHMLARVALVDPELALGLPRAITASTGMDALSQLIEPFVSHRANPMTNALCREGIRRAARSLALACENGAHLVAREDLAVASLFSGMALANAGLGAVHGLAAPVGGMFPAPHGAVCAALLAPVMETNVRALRAGDPGSFALSRYAEIAQIVTGKPAARIEDGVAWVRDLAQRLEIPGLGTYGITAADFAALSEMAAMSSSMKGNPIKLTRDELHGILVLSR